MKALLKFIVADVRMRKRTELLLRYLLLGLLFGLAVCFLIIWIPLELYGEVGIFEPNDFVRRFEIGIFTFAICFSSWMALFYARRGNGKGE
ncbi:hypothetical protein ES705_48548 [subsurface metagenome]